MKKQTSIKLTLSALFIACGIILPYTFHSVANFGRIFLPMHIPVLLGGLLLGSFYGGLIGFLTPILSCLLTGMPTAFPMLPIMVAELTTYGFIIGVITPKIHTLPRLLTAMVIGRISYFAMFLMMTKILNLKLPPALSIINACVVGIWGIAIQIVLIPVIHSAIIRIPNFQNLRG